MLEPANAQPRPDRCAAHAVHLVGALAIERAQKPPEEIAPHLAAAQEALREAQRAVTAADGPRLKTALARFGAAYEPVRKWTAENKFER